MFVACALAVAAPVVADTSTSTPDSVPLDGATVSSTPDSSSPEADPSTTTTGIDEPLEFDQPGFATGPAVVSGQRPARGPRVQLATPPPGPFDPPADSGTGRRVVYSKTKQTVWVYDETDTIIKMHRVSGRQDPGDPLPGVYRVWSRSTTTFAINNPTITWNYMIRFAKGDRDGNIGFHDIPYQYGQPVQTVGQLGQALSGGCVRQAPGDAIWMWNWAQIGTVVVVTP